mmetsp:Transcript_5412/g.7318  ORF Transcript_5412/g.7318 Transcript_5412/m.7318 type:complete len:229 (-) Transcript_5412:212-898(-)
MNQIQDIDAGSRVFSGAESGVHVQSFMSQPSQGFPVGSNRNFQTHFDPTSVPEFMPTVPGIPVPRRDWTKKLRELKFGTGTCCLAYWCPCIVFAENHARVKTHMSEQSPRSDECSRCLFFGLLWPGIPTAITLLCGYMFVPFAVAAWLPMHSYAACYSAPTRRAIMDTYAIQEVKCPSECCIHEACVHSFCMTCALVQERAEIERMTSSSRPGASPLEMSRLEQRMHR